MTNEIIDSINMSLLLITAIIAEIKFLNKYERNNKYDR